MNTRTSSVLLAPQFPLQQFITADARWRLLFVLLGVLQLAIAVQAQVTNPPLCTYVFFPSNGIHSAESGFGLVTVTTSPGCPWSAFTTNSWIHPDSSATNFGSGSMGYFVDANESTFQRIGLIRFGNRIFQVRQAGNSNTPPACTYALSPPSAYHGAGESTNAVEVGTSPNCFWLATTTNEWISVLSSPTNFGSGLVIYRVAANPGVNRSGFIRIDGQNFLVAQAGNTNPPVVCTYSLFPSNGMHSAGSGTGLVSVTTAPGCPWGVFTTNSWIQIASSLTNTGSGTVEYFIDANPSFAARIGSIRIDGRNFLVRQAGNTNTPVCTYALSPVEAAYNANPGTGSVSVVTAAGCPWGISTTNEWIHTASSLTNVGSGTVNYFIDANQSTTMRVGFIRIDGQDFMITQAGNMIPPECEITLTPTTRTHPWMVSTGTVAVATGSNCFWFARTTNSWITILPPATNYGSRTLSYRVLGNTGSATRFGAIQIDGKFLTVIQFANTNPPVCTYAISPSNGWHSAGSETGSVSVVTAAGCPWGVSTTNSWITIVSGLTNSGSGTVDYFIDANPSASERVGIIRIDGRVFFVNQAGAPPTNECLITISPTSRVHGPGSETAFIHVSVPPGCYWGYANTNDWITTLPIVGPGDGDLRYTVAANPFPATRTGVMFISGQPYLVTQLGATNGTPECQITLTPTTRTHPWMVSTGTVAVATGSNCFWFARTTNSWITILPPATNYGSRTLSYRVQGNAGNATRFGSIQIDGKFLTVIQFANSNGPGTNACSYAIAPASRSHGAGPSTNVVEVNTSSNCFWLATTTNEWINLLSSPTNFGSGLVLYALAANPGPGRVGAIRIDGQNFLVTQSGTTNAPGSNLPPVVRMILPLDGSSFAMPVTLGFAADAQDSDGSVVSVEFFANGVSIGQAVRSTTGAPWQVNQWYFSWSNVPPAEYAFTAKATDNRGLAGFSPPVHVWVYSTNTPPVCTFALSPPSRTHGSGVSTGIVSVVTSANCFWSARSTNSWITILSPTTNFGQGTVFYRLAANPGPTRVGAIRIDGQNFLVTQIGTTNPPSTLVNLGTVVVSNITHEFLNQQLPDRPWMPSVVVDYLIDQSHDTGPGASLPSVSVNWNTKTQFTLRVTAPPGRKFLVRVPEGNSASFGGFLWWESTGAGATRPGTVAVTLEGLEGPSPDFSDSLSMLSDSHGFFGFVDVTSSYFSGRLTFTGIQLVGTVPPQITGSGIQDFTPHINSSLVVFYSTPETNDPGRFVSIVPAAPILVTPPSPGNCPILSLHEPEGRMLVVECSEDLVHWRPISTNVAPCQVFDWGGTNSLRRFYRAVELPRVEGL